MRKRPSVYETNTELTLTQLEHAAQGWILDGRSRQMSPRTIQERRAYTEKLCQFLREAELPVCDTFALRAFLAQAAERKGKQGRPIQPSTQAAYFRVLRAFFNFCVEEGRLTESPMAVLRPPIVRQDQVQPFTHEQVTRLLAAAKTSFWPERDEALLRLLLDTGVRAFELCSLQIRDADLEGRSLLVREGKGRKGRRLYFGRKATRALWAYLRSGEPREPNQPLFINTRGGAQGQQMTPNGLARWLRRLGRAAKVKEVRCSPHTCRHFFAVEFLRNGGSTFTLMQLLGHTSLAMTRRYVALAEADLEAQHRLASPMDRVKE